MDQWPASATTADPVVEGVESGLVERHGPLVVELAERHSEPGAVVGVVDNTVEFEIEQFAEAQTGAAQDLDGAASGGDTAWCWRAIDTGRPAARRPREERSWSQTRNPSITGRPSWSRRVIDG